MRRIEVLNGPSMNLLGQRQPHLYGHATLADAEALCRPVAEALGLVMRWRQSNREDELLGWVQEASSSAAGLAINPGGLTFTSAALRDALAKCAAPVVEVHVSNLMKREAFRHHSLVSTVASAVIAGFGIDGYPLALRRLHALMN